MGGIIAAVSDIEGDYHILVIDDGSPDGTADAVRSIQKQCPDRIFLIERSGKLGILFWKGLSAARKKRLCLLPSV